jgi:hypothetical protein
LDQLPLKPDRPWPDEVALTSAADRFSSLTSEIVDQFARELLKTGSFDGRLVQRLRAVVLAEATPRPKDIEGLLQEEEPLE